MSQKYLFCNQCCETILRKIMYSNVYSYNIQRSSNFFLHFIFISKLTLLHRWALSWRGRRSQPGWSTSQCSQNIGSHSHILLFLETEIELHINNKYKRCNVIKRCIKVKHTLIDRNFKCRRIETSPGFIPLKLNPYRAHTINCLSAHGEEKIRRGAENSFKAATLISVCPLYPQ